MKLFKKLAVLCMALSLVSVAFVACGKDKDTTSGSATSSVEETTGVTAINNGYTFLVKDANGQPAAGYMIQLCDANGCQGSPASTATGVINMVKAAGEYEIHLMLLSDSSTPKFEATVDGAKISAKEVDGDGTAYPVTPSAYGKVIEITLE